MSYVNPAALFAGTEAQYLRFRAAHPDVFLDLIAAQRPAGTVLDLGCGPGSIALPLADRGRDVIAVDVNPRMIEAARAAAARRMTRGKVRWQVGDAHELSGVGPVAGVTIGDAFHWFDRARVLADLDRLVVPGGFVALVMSFAASTAKPWWYTVADQVLRRHLGAVRHAGPEAMYDPPQGGDHETILRASPFNQLTVMRTDQLLRLDLAQVLGNQYTQAYSSPPLFGEHFDDFDQDLRAALCAAEPSGVFVATVQPALIIARRGEDT
ncbi:methyltransferase domain-containing protein [Dactylosporangium sp. NPDC051485]|uniref:class I SAM-dependent methyltransferase n=1 Tax=Dactylosporangium sp. NPDC051485 TaxID=3154846 RepID=UPI00341D4EFC